MGMRITNGMMIDKFVVNMQNNLQKTDKYTSQLSTGRKIVKLSDDSVGVYNALTARQRLARFEQYQENLTTALSWTESCERSLQDISSLMADILESDIDAATNVKNEGDRRNIAMRMKELKNAITDSLNASVGGQYIFAGFNTLNPPMSEGTGNDGTTKMLYNGVDLTDLSGDNGERIQKEKEEIFSLELGYGVHEPVAMTAIDVIGTGDENLYEVIDGIIELMDSGRDDEGVVEELSSLISGLKTNHTNITSCLARVGAMSTNMELLENRYAQDVINYNEIRSQIEDVDSAEAIMDWKMVEAVYKQSLAVGARIIQPTLMDFLN